jgi:hypothetical protein
MAINGRENAESHSSESPNRAPACEYVAIPEGSSSAAPVVNPIFARNVKLF